MSRPVQQYEYPSIQKRAEVRAAKREVQRLRDAFWKAPVSERDGLLAHVNNALAILAALQAPPEKQPDRTESAFMRLTKDEKKRLSAAAKKGKTTVSDLCRSGGLLNAALILDLPKQ